MLFQVHHQREKIPKEQAHDPRVIIFVSVHVVLLVIWYVGRHCHSRKIEKVWVQGMPLNFEIEDWKVDGLVDQVRRGYSRFRSVKARKGFPDRGNAVGFLRSRPTARRGKAGQGDGYAPLGNGTRA